MDAQACKCGKAAKYNEVKKEGPNNGRFFYACDTDKTKGGCGFFKWADGMPNLSQPQGGSNYGKFQKEPKQNHQPYGQKQSNWQPPFPQPIKGFNGTGSSIPDNVTICGPFSSPPVSPARTTEEKSDREVALYLLADKLDRVEIDYRACHTSLTNIQNKLNQIMDLLDKENTQEIVQ